MTTRTEPAEVTAYVSGWRQNDNGGWERPGTKHDGLTLHAPGDESEFGYVLAPSAAEAVRIDRETFGNRRANY